MSLWTWKLYFHPFTAWSANIQPDDWFYVLPFLFPGFLFPEKSNVFVKWTPNLLLKKGEEGSESGKRMKWLVPCCWRSSADELHGWSWLMIRCPASLSAHLTKLFFPLPSLLVTWLQVLTDLSSSYFLCPSLFLSLLSLSHHWWWFFPFHLFLPLCFTLTLTPNSDRRKPGIRLTEGVFKLKPSPADNVQKYDPNHGTPAGLITPIIVSSLILVLVFFVGCFVCSRDSTYSTGNSNNQRTTASSHETGE